MLYLEDYLEIIEHLPQELRDRFTEMRELDLQVQNSVDNLEERVKRFFPMAKKMKQSERDIEYRKIDQDFYKTLEDADEKVHIANQVYELVEKYIRKLDQELLKFKMELEADNAGITEVLEKRSLELDNPQPLPSMTGSDNKSEKKKISKSSSFDHNSGKRGTGKSSSSERDSTSNRVSLAGSSSSSSISSTASDHTVSHPKSHAFGGGNALAAAASQAIAATQQSLRRSTNQNQAINIQQGRRSASLKASYDAVSSGNQTWKKDGASGSRDLPSKSTTVTTSPSESKMKTKKATRAPKVKQQPEPTPTPEDSDDSSFVDESGAEWNYDPSEPRYCICNQVSYGDMVACDNGDCPFEWFHYPCVGITQSPKGKWFCPQCTVSMKRRGRKEK